MDQVKIGKFIAKSRKESNLTQQELADRLGVTDRAVSHWENGRSLPDVSLFKKLCEILNISINELINGEKIAEEKEKRNYENISTPNNIKKDKKYSKYIIILLFSIVLLIISLIYIKNYLKTNLITDNDYLYDKVINILKHNELKSNPDNIKKDFNVFYSYHKFGIEEKGDYKYVYMWIYSTSYYIEGEDSLAISSSSSNAYKVTIKNDDIINIEKTKDNDRFKISVKDLFPKDIVVKILNFNVEENINKLQYDVENKKNIYYNYLSLDMNNITIDDLSYEDLIFSITISKSECIPIQLNIYKDNKYILNTAYKECKKGKPCTDNLEYTSYIDGTYNYDVIEIIKHSIDANNIQFISEYLPKYTITSGKGNLFVTGDDNKYLNEFLKLIDIDLSKCAKAEYY
ncbi:MAG: helix-turn-helix domain-containing protein [bacterium]|nr:helix-turn-helix domain-containing protein [bacterium]